MDGCLYHEGDELRLGITMFETNTSVMPEPRPPPITTYHVLPPVDGCKHVDTIGLFETEMYMSGMHGGHAGKKTSAFKRCMFLKNIGTASISNILLSALGSRPSSLYYLHLLQGDGVIRDIASNASAFGCLDWDFACIITGVWPRDQDGSDVARAATQWEYDVAKALLPLSGGAYGADLGPDSRDLTPAARAFGPSLHHLARLKGVWDTQNVLAYAFPLQKGLVKQKLIILVTGEICAGKDYCADVCASVLNERDHKAVKARAVSTSEATKREHAAVCGVDLERLLKDRDYKEQHR